MIARRIGVMLLLGSLAFPGLAWAEPDDDFPEQKLQQASYAVTNAPLSKTFAKLDTNQDGRISVAEAGNRSLPEPFWILDRNQDGFLTRQEYRRPSHN